MNNLEIINYFKTILGKVFALAKNNFVWPLVDSKCNDKQFHNSEVFEEESFSLVLDSEAQYQWYSSIQQQLSKLW